MGMVFKSGIFATLGAALGAADTTITLTSGHESRFNTWLATQYDYTWLTVVKISDPLKPYERIKVKGPLTGASIPVVARGQDGTSALSFNSGERIELRLCAPMLERFVEAEDSQTLADVLAVSVGGTVNVITATHTYPLSDLVGSGNAPTNGMTSVFVPSGRNSSASVTYSPDGLTAKAIVLPGNKTLPEGALRPSMKALVVYDSAIGAWILQNAASVPFEALAGTISVATTLDRSHHGKVIQATGTFTLSLSAAATLGADWWAIVQVQSGIVTIDPNGTEQIVLPNQVSGNTISQARGAVFITCDGTKFNAYPINGTTNFTMYSTAGTYTHRFNPMTKNALCVAIGGGGAGGVGYNTQAGGGGGGSGGYNAVYTAAFAREETVTVGAGGATASASGGTTSIGSLVSATGGTGGTTGANFPGTGGAGGSPNGTAGSSGVYAETMNGGAGGTNARAAWLNSTAGSGGTSGVNATAGTFGSGGGGGHGSTTPFGAGGTGVAIIMESN